MCCQKEFVRIKMGLAKLTALALILCDPTGLAIQGSLYISKVVLRNIAVPIIVCLTSKRTTKAIETI